MGNNCNNTLAIVEIVFHNIIEIFFKKNLDILNGLQKRIGNKYSILSKNRFLLKEGPLVVLSPHLGTVTHIYLVLVSFVFIRIDLNFIWIIIYLCNKKNFSLAIYWLFAIKPTTNMISYNPSHHWVWKEFRLAPMWMLLI